MEIFTHIKQWTFWKAYIKKFYSLEYKSKYFDNAF